jgi:hypothetical protein
MKQRSSAEVNSCSASQEIPSILSEVKIRCCSQKPATGPYPKPDESSPHPPILLYDPL